MFAAWLVVLFLTVAMLLPAVSLKAEPVDVTGPPDMVVTGETAESWAGKSVAFLDINHDEAADLVVGARGDNDGGTNAGKVLIYLGNPDESEPLDSDPDVVIVGWPGDRFGWAVANAGDLNGDTYDDLVVGAPWNSTGGLYSGKVCIFFGYGTIGTDPGDLDLDASAANITILGSANGRLGYSVSTAGDLNQDSHDDIIVGEPYALDGAGQAQIYYGGDPMDASADKTFPGPSEGDSFGISVAGGVNLDGTLQKDVAVGAPGVGNGRGAVQVILNPAKAAPKIITLQASSTSSEKFGQAVALVDINDDQYGDVAVGAPNAGDVGKVYVYFGSSLISKFDKTADLVLSVGAAGDEFGSSLASGDPWTDSKGDLVVGAPYNDEGAVNGGRAYVFFGNSSIEQYTEPDMIVQGDTKESEFGHSVASGSAVTADFNGDGAADFAVGSPDDGPGAAYLYLGVLVPVEDNPTLYGWVNNSDGPLDGALVLVESASYSGTFSTESDGSYGIVDEISVPPGVYDITASYDDHFSDTVEDVSMALGQDYHVQDFMLGEYPIVNGVVYDGLSPSDPLQGVLVQALDDADEVLGEMTTGATGVYEFVLEYEGLLEINASMDDYFDAETEFSVERDKVYPTSITLHHKPVLLVTVRDSASIPPNQPIEGADVVVTIDDVEVASGTTDEEGEVSMVVDDQGSATVTVTATGYVGDSEILDLMQDDSESLVFSLERQPVIIGLVQDGVYGTPISGAKVEQFDGGTSVLLDTTWTGGDGMYSFDFVEVGTYDLTASAVGYVPLTHTGIKVTANEMEICDFDLDRDAVPPESSVTGIDPEPDPMNIVDVLELTIFAEATDSKSEIETVALYWREGETGIYRTSDDLVDSEAPYAFDFTAEEGDGVYSFYTIATDCAGNVEAPPAGGANDTWVVVSSGIPVSFVEAIVPYEQSTDTFPVTVDSNHVFDIVSVELWYSFDGGGYDMCEEVGDDVPYTWDFVAVHGDGVYSFYSRVEDQYGQVEPIPVSPDTSALVDTTLPGVTIESPDEGQWFLVDPEVPLVATVTDTGVGLDLVGYRVDSGDDEVIELDGESSYELDEMLTLPDGTHTIAVWAIDTLGWESGEVLVTFDVDITKPELLITYPEDGSAVPTADVLVTWTVNEEVQKTRIAIDGGWDEVPDGETSYLYSGQEDGLYTVTVEVTDLAGHEDTESSTFWVDTELPKVEIEEPEPFLTSDVVIKWFQEDLYSGIKTSQIRLDDGDWEDADTEVENVEHEFFSVSQGMHTVEVVVTDEAGNEAKDDATFMVDGTSPIVTIDSPYNGEIFGTDSVELEWSIEDAGTGVDYAEYKLDAETWQSLPSDAGSLTRYDLSDGSHTITVRAFDVAGNDDQAVVQFTVDTLAPDVSISSPVEDDVRDTSDVDIVYTADGTGTDIVEVEMRVDGGTWETVGPSPITLASLDDDDYTVEIRATDEAGHSAIAMVNFTVDAFVLDVEITDPAEDGLWFDTDTVTVTWTVSDLDATVEVKLDYGAWQPATGDSMTFSDLADGEHTVTVWAIDDASNEGFDSVTFYVDATPPTVSIESPEEGAIIGSSSVEVSWTSTDADTTECSVDGGALQAVVGTSVTISSLSDGEHTILIQVSDVVGHEATDTVTVMIDTTGPTVEITAPSEGATLGTDVTVQWTTDDGSGSGVDDDAVEVRIDGGEWIAASGSSHTFTGLAPGEHTVDVNATDGAGNEGNDSVTFTVSVDTTAPTVSITSPTNGSSLPSSSVTVIWAASDGTGSGIDTVDVKLDNGAWNAVTTSSQSFTGLADGSHTVSVRVTDNAGNSATVSVTFMVDTVSPTLSITSPDDGWETSDKSVTITWTCTDVGCGVDRIEVRLDDGSFVTVTASEKTFSNLEAGEHQVDVRVYDKAGNMVDASVAFSVSDEGGGISALLVGGIVLAIIVLAAVAVMLMRRKKAGTTPPPTE
jgi:hypothetical protein